MDLNNYTERKAKKLVHLEKRDNAVVLISQHFDHNLGHALEPTVSTLHPDLIIARRNQLINDTKELNTILQDIATTLSNG